MSEQYFNTYKKEIPNINQKVEQVIYNFTHDAQGREINVKSSTSTIVIPVVFNVIHNGETEGTGRNLSTEKIKEQIDILNSAYSGEYGGVDTKIRFCLASTDIFGNKTSGIFRYYGPPQFEFGDSQIVNGQTTCVEVFDQDANVKGFTQSGFPNTYYLRIWTTDIKNCGADDMLGYSSFPYGLIVEQDYMELEDGVVLDYKYVGTNGSNGSLGLAAVHEVGHWLGLFHIFPEGDEVPCVAITDCELDEDLICDTDRVPSSGIDNQASGDCMGYNCAGQVTAIVQNFMDYQKSDRFNCQKSFTEGQKQRMRDILTFYRGSIESQSEWFNFTGCSFSTPSSNGGGCTNVHNIQEIFEPVYTQSYSRRRFGPGFDVDDEWLVALDAAIQFIPAGETPTTRPCYLRIYKREGCLYNLHQSIELPVTLDVFAYDDYGIILNDDEIIFSDLKSVTDSKGPVFIYRYNQWDDEWNYSQQIASNSSTTIGRLPFLLDNFLFLTEIKDNEDNLRVYHKNSTGTYVYHQTISYPNFDFTSGRKPMKAVNFVNNVVNINSATYVGSYDPQEILIKEATYFDFAILSLNSNNMWTVSNVITAPGYGNDSNEAFADLEVTNDYIYFVTTAQGTVEGSAQDWEYIYSYKRNPNSLTQFNSGYAKVALFHRQDAIGSTRKIDLNVIGDEFLFVDNSKGSSPAMFYNQAAGTTSIPSWVEKDARISCSNARSLKTDKMKFFGNLLFYGIGSDIGFIQILDMTDILDYIGFSSYVGNCSIYNKSICQIPEDYVTFAEEITIGENCNISFGNTKKKFIAEESITMKPGTTILSGSNVDLKVVGNYEVCNTIIASRGVNTDYDQNDLIFEGAEDNTFETEGVKLFPNPANSLTTIMANSGIIKAITVVSMDGKLILTQGVGSQSVDLDVSRYNSGIYIINIEMQSGKYYTQKLMKN